ncbi:MAG: BlaI/MecI/CopY family transcriptional regulator [Candidatus Bathyarchaeia archaeon]
MRLGYKEICLDLVWKMPSEGLVSSEIHRHVQKRLGGLRISRTAVSQFLNRLCREGVLKYSEETCRGGRRRRYFLRKSKGDYERELVRESISRMLRSQPRCFFEVLAEFLDTERLGPDVWRSLLSLLMSRDQITYAVVEQALTCMSNPVHM